MVEIVAVGQSLDFEPIVPIFDQFHFVLVVEVAQVDLHSKKKTLCFLDDASCSFLLIEAEVLHFHLRHDLYAFLCRDIHLLHFFRYYSFSSGD